MIITLALTYAVNMNGQNFAFIGENSYPSTEKFTLQSNSDKEDIGDLNLVFAKDGTTSLIIVSSKLGLPQKLKTPNEYAGLRDKIN